MNFSYLKYTLISITICAYMFSGNAQSVDSNVDSVVTNLIEYNFYKADSLLENIESTETKKLLTWQLLSIKNGIHDTLAMDKGGTLNEVNTILLDLCKADALLKNKGSISEVFERYRICYTKAEDSNHPELSKLSLYKIIGILYGKPQTSELLNEYLKIFENHISTPNDRAVYHFYAESLASFRERKPKIKELKNILKIIENEKLPYIKGKVFQEIGIQYDYYLSTLDSTLSYYELALKSYQQIDGEEAKTHLYGIFNNIGYTYHQKNNFSEAVVYYSKAEEYVNNDIEKRNNLYLALAETYRAANKNDSAYYYLSEHKKTTAEIKQFELAASLTDIDIKYQTAEKEKQLLIEKAEKEKNRNIAIGLGGGLTAVTIIGFLVYNNSRRKQRIAEQEKELEVRKKEKILKDQELTTIDAMIAGQEKERIRLAGDLHDSVGATLAAARLQFDHLHKNKENAASLDEMFVKTSALLEDAYIEIRGMAHAKNSGVIAKNGLLPAVEKLAKNSSVGTELVIHVSHFGLENRLENTLEISVFRVIQELTTNIIKHAEATEATISITQHDDSLSLIIEDNGKGFAPFQRKKNGMGLDGIEKRIEHMEGSMEVDSASGKGTSVLIDIPL